MNKAAGNLNSHEQRVGVPLGGLVSFTAARDTERRMLAEAAASNTFTARPASFDTFALWQTPTALVVPSGMPRIKGFERAAGMLSETGWPVFERDTGGDLTPQFDGILNFSTTFTLMGDERNIAASYGRLIAPVLGFLREDLGVDAYASSVEGAFCDGAHNIVVDGRKLAGTAQRWRLSPGKGDKPGPTHVLGHIAIVCGGDLDGALDAVNRFYDACAISRRVVRDAHITLQQAASEADVTPKYLAERLAAFITRTSPTCQLDEFPEPQSG